MTQYHYDRPPTTAVETAAANQKQDRDLKSLQDRVTAQERELQELRRTVRRLQNEIRGAVNAFNLKQHG